MRNLSHQNQHQTSREFYNQVLKKKSKNLNSSKKEVNIFENGLNKLLKYSYQLLAPIFNDTDNNINYHKETESNSIDKDFDNQIETISPRWLKLCVKFLIEIYHFVFPKKIKEIIRKTYKTNIIKPIKTKTNSSVKNNNNFFAFKPPS